MRNGVTLIELIFVVVLLAVLSATAVMVIPNNQAISDAKYISALLNEKRFHAQGDQSKRSCIELEKSALSDQYVIKSELIIDPDTITQICFDWMGRVYEDNTTNEQISQIVDINVISGGRTVSIMLFPLTGYVKINN